MYILQEDQDWGFVAMVLDRLFLWLFTTASLFGTFSILCEAPALWVSVWCDFRLMSNNGKNSYSYDDTEPIDIKISIIAQKIFNITPPASLHKDH